MGSDFSVNQSAIFESVNNNTLQQIENKCAFVCANNTKNVDIDIVDSPNVTVDLNQTCSVAGTSCVARTYLDTEIQNSLSAIGIQKNSNDSNYLMFNASSNQATITEMIRNNVSQMVSNFCNQESTNVTENLYIYVKNSANSRVTLAQSGSVSNAQCAFDVTAKMSIMNQESAKIDQSNINRGALADLIIILGIVFGIAVLFFLVFMLKGGKGGDSPQTCDDNNAQQCQQIESKLLAAKTQSAKEV
jgi:hypothetical protein